MFKNYLKTALKFLGRNKLFAIINVLGLSIALSVSFIILIYVINEVSYNHGHKNRNRAYRALTYYVDFKNLEAGTPYAMMSALREEFPQVEQAVNVRGASLGVKLNENEFMGVHTVATESGIFDIFTLPLVWGSNDGKLLDNPNSMVLSRNLAEKIFPGENPVGKPVEGVVNGQQQIFNVTAVYEDIPRNSTFQAQCLVNGQWTLGPINRSFAYKDEEGQLIEDADVNWHRNFWTTWVLLRPGVKASDLDAQFRTLETKHLGEKPIYTYSLQKLSDVYLKSDDIGNTGMKGSMSNIRLFGSIAFLIVLVAAINYIILSTAVATGRSKEIGIRKTNGAGTGDIKGQLLSESVLLAIIVLPIALLLMKLFIPRASELFSTRLEFLDSNMAIYILFYILLTLFIGVASGLYSSFYLGRLKVIDILKNTGSTGRRRIHMRSVLIVIQLVIFCCFVSGTLIIRQQYNYAVNKDMGFNRNNVLLINLGRNFPSYTALLNGFKSIPYVINSAATMTTLPEFNTMSSVHPHFENPENMIEVEGMAVDYNYLETMGLQLVEGRYFSEEFGSDLQNSVILNETAIKRLGIENPLEKQYAGRNIIGIAKDFNLHSIHRAIPPLSINLNDKYIGQVAVHYREGTLENLIPMLEAEWQKVVGERPFNYRPIEEVIAGSYAKEKNLSKIVSIFALFTLLICAFGLFGLTLFVAKTRTKEIGVKKVFGSSEGSIVLTFINDNLKLVVIATILSIPVTFFVMMNWLNGFAYKTKIGWWVFLVAFGIAAVVVLLTVIYQSVRASRVNPVKALRYE